MTIHPMDRHPSPASRSESACRAVEPRRRSFGALVGAMASLTLGVMLGPVAAASAQDGAQEVTIEKATNGVDADGAPGVSVDAGQPVTWTWTVRASGSTTLYDLVVTDDGPVQPDCDVDGDGQPDGTAIHPGPLEPGQTFTCQASGGGDLDPAAGTYAATGQVRASDFAASATFQDSDPSHHTPTAPFEPRPGVSIQALVNGQLVDGADAPLVAEGSDLTWSYVVTNTGNVPLTGIEVGDGSSRSVNCGGGSSVIVGPLAPGDSVTCTAAGRAVDQSAGPQSTTATVVAGAVDPRDGALLGSLRADDLAAYVPVQVPGQLAFTGPTDWLWPLGLVATVAGAVLCGATSPARRRPQEG